MIANGTIAALRAAHKVLQNAAINTVQVGPVPVIPVVGGGAAPVGAGVAGPVGPVGPAGKSPWRI